MRVAKMLRTILLGLIIAAIPAACAIDDSESPGARPPTATPDDQTPTTPPDDQTPSPTATSSPSPNAPRETPPEQDLLTVGDRGPAVTEVQTMLKTLGYRLAVDGVFG
jgi:peptidoglycan hydrolase-like protein with peptidoglycan-binding domain